MVIELQEWEEVSLTIALTSNDLLALFEFSKETLYFDINIRPRGTSIKARDYVGQCIIELPDHGKLCILIQPKTKLFYLMQWWCLANYIPTENRPNIHLETVTDCLDQLAYWFTSLLLQQHRKGLLSAYKKVYADLASPKGKINCLQAAQRSLNGLTTIPCHYETRTQDILENKLLLYTVEVLKRHSFSDEKTRSLVRTAQRTLQSSCSSSGITPQSFYAITYSRINQHYMPLHTLARMIIESLSFSNHIGQIPFKSFMLPMNRIYESAIANGIEQLLPDGLKLCAQEYHLLSRKPLTSCKMDLVIRDNNDEAVLVLDTKYKNGCSPSNSDIYQLITYAEILGISKAYLVYPTIGDSPLDCSVNTITCKSTQMAMDRSPEDSILACLKSIPEIIDTTYQSQQNVLSFLSLR